MAYTTAIPTPAELQGVSLSSYSERAKNHEKSSQAQQKDKRGEFH